MFWRKKRVITKEIAPPPQNSAEAISTLFNDELNTILAQELEYGRSADRNKLRVWVLLRVPAILSFLAGILAPAFSQMGFSEVRGIDTLALGYFFLVLSGGLAVIERYALFTELHMIRRTAEVSLAGLKYQLLHERNATLPTVGSERAARALLPAVAETIKQFATKRDEIVRTMNDATGSARRAADKEFAEGVGKPRDDARAELAQKRAEQVERERLPVPGTLIARITYPQNYENGLKVEIDYEDDKIPDIRPKPYRGAPAEVEISPLQPGSISLKVKLTSGEEKELTALIKADELTDVEVIFE